MDQVGFVWLFCGVHCNVPVTCTSYGQSQTVSYPTHAFFLGKLRQIWIKDVLQCFALSIQVNRKVSMSKDIKTFTIYSQENARQ